MKPHPLWSFSVNAMLVLVAVVSLAPLLWMLSVSFMQTGEAGHFPPPLLPSHATFDNYRELFLRAGMGRFLFNSFLISSCVMLLSVLFNTLAGYAFAKLRFKGRDRTFRALLAALVIPALCSQVPSPYLPIWNSPPLLLRVPPVWVKVPTRVAFRPT
jgi:multiple sugar transport system permease protein